MDDALDFSRLRALRREKPGTVMGLVRLAWPDIKAALERGHTLRVVHECLVEAGVPVAYRQLSAYIGRIERKNSPQRESPAVVQPVSPPDSERPAAERAPVAIAAADPLANVRERSKKPPGFHFEDEPADESKLI